MREMALLFDLAPVRVWRYGVISTVGCVFTIVCRYLLRAICALYDGLSPEVANGMLFPLDEEFADLKEHLKQYYPCDPKTGKLKNPNVEGVRCTCCIYIFHSLWHCRWCVPLMVVSSESNDPMMMNWRTSSFLQRRSRIQSMLSSLCCLMVVSSTSPRHFLVILVIRVHGTSPNCVTSLLVRIIALYNLHTHLFHTDKLYGIVGDAAFTFNKVGDKGNVIGVTPYSNKYGNTLTEEQREDNTNIARIRVIVENVFALLKKWECLSCMCYPIVSVTPLLTVSQQAKADMLDSKT